MSPEIIFGLRILTHFAPWDILGLESISIFSTISSLCVINCFKYFFNIYFGQNVSKNQIGKTISSLHVVKYPFTLKLYTLKALLSKICSIFFSSSDMQKFQLLLGNHAIGISSSLIFFKCFTFFKFNMPRQKSENIFVDQQKRCSD